MFCPSCKCEYIRGVTQCAECGVALVDALPPEEDAHPREEFASVWSGSGSGELDEVKGALAEAGITPIDREAAGYLFFPSIQPQREVFVSRKDQERARQVLSGLGLWHDPSELTDEERASLELPGSDAAADPEPVDLTEDSVSDWDEDVPVTEIWSGGEEDLADNLSACLREVGIASRKVSGARGWSLAVRPEHEARAREIVREVVEAAPPQ
jgi:hypothetical protein